MASSLSRKIPTIIGILLLAATLFTAYTATSAIADHEPAMKAAAVGSDLDQVNDATPILAERMRVSSPEDLIIQVTAECSILTHLITGGEGPSDPAASDTSFSYGSVRLWVEIDGKRVPVSTDELPQDTDDENSATDAPDTDDTGEVTFCNRAYQRTVTDGESPQDGLDQEDDYIRTRTANAFNWVAFDTGFDYDLDDDNVLEVELWADFDETVVGRGTADAFVGSRTMVLEPIRVSNHESMDPVEGDVTPERGNGKP